jgi:hypothetical protein
MSLSVNERNHLKLISYILLALGVISLPVDFPYHLEIAAVLSFLFVVGSALANYLTDPSTVVTNLEAVATATAKAVNTIKTAPAQPAPTLTPNTLQEAETMLNQALANYKALAAGQTPPAAP